MIYPLYFFRKVPKHQKIKEKPVFPASRYPINWNDSSQTMSQTLLLILSASLKFSFGWRSVIRTVLASNL